MRLNQSNNAAQMKKARGILKKRMKIVVIILHYSPHLGILSSLEKLKMILNVDSW